MGLISRYLFIQNASQGANGWLGEAVVQRRHGAWKAVTSQQTARQT